MADPHVEALHYLFKSRQPLDKFDEAQPLNVVLADFDCELADGKLVARPRLHLAFEQDARAALEPMLRSWEQAAFVSALNYRIAFVFDYAEIIDRSPGPNVTVYPGTARASAIAMDASVSRSNRTYPSPDPAFVATPLSDWMVERLRRVRDHEAELVATAYNILTKGEESGVGQRRKRDAAALVWGVELAVLDKLGELTGRRDPQHGRKQGAIPEPVTQKELEWILAASTALVRRSGELGTQPGLPVITMASLPPI